ncbi:MAG: histidine kinase, partial [Caldilinea sp.]
MPLTILLIVVSLTGIGAHQASMRRLAIDENRRLVTVMAQALALLVVDAPLSQAPLDALLPVDDGYESQVLLIDGDGRILFSNGAEPEPLPTIQIDGSTDSLATFAGAEYIVVSAPVPGFSWRFVLREPLTHLTEPLIRFEQAMPFVLLIATVVSFLTLFFGLRFIVRPLRLLAERTHRIGEGDFTSLGKPVGGVDEIEALRRAIDQMAERIQSYQAGLETYLHVVTRAQEDERARLARELHDETVQSLIALDHKTQKVQRTLDRDPALAHVQLTELRQLIVKSIGEVRRFSQALRPLYLEELGLAPALE